MAFRRSLDFLPSFFRTETNSKFLNATLDQLISEPELKRLDGYIGRKFAPSYRENDGYIDEFSSSRQNYQLEPSTIYKDAAGKVQLVSTYQDLLNRISSFGGIVTDHSRLFASEQYTYSGLFDFDKFSNYASYYWLPNGPDSVDVNNVDIPYEQEFKVTPPAIYQTILGEFQRENFDTSGFDSSVNPIARVRNDGYKIDAYGDKINPTIRLARGGTYTFSLDQLGHGFYIQTAPGLNTSTSWQQNLSIRDVYGVENNGIDIGSLTFTVPNKDAQDYFINMSAGGSANFVARSNAKNRLFRYVDVQYANYAELISVHGGLDGQRFVDGKTVVFLKDPALTETPKAWSSYTDYVEGEVLRYGTNIYRVLTDFTSGRLFGDTNLELYDAANDWYDPVPFDGDDFPFDSSNFDRGSTVAIDDRTATFRVSIVDGLIKLTPEIRTDLNTKVAIGEGIGYGNRQVYHTTENYFEVVPNLTANLDYLYYQDSLDPNINGIIEIIDQDDNGLLDVESSILGRANYISPNNVTFTNGLKIKFRGKISPESYSDREFYVEGVGDSIKLVPFDELVTPDTWADIAELPFDYVLFDSSGFDAANNAPLGKDYITINRSSRDRNSWSRTNRWFHQDVIEATARYNNYETIFDYDAKAKRPIIEFHPDLQLFNYGKIAKQPITLMDLTTTDAFSQVEGMAVRYDYNAINTYNVDGVPLTPDSRVIFAADLDDDVRNKIYKVSWIRPASQTDDRIAVFEGDKSTATYDLNFDVPDPNRLTVTVDGVDANDAGYIWSMVGLQNLVFEENPAIGLRLPGDGSVIIVRQIYGLQIHLELDDDTIQKDDVVLVTAGTKNKGLQFWFDGNQWIKTQTKFSLNQAPLFDLVDTNGISLSDPDAYPSNNFTGNKIFGYKTQSSGARDPELGLRLKYRNFNNVGDIVFSDFLTSSQLNYRQGTQAISSTTSGSRVIYNVPDGTTQYLNQWQVNEFPTQQYQTQTFFATAYQRNLFLLNVLPTDRVEPLSPESILVYVNNRSVNNDKFDIQLEGNQGYLFLNSDLAPGDKLDVRIATGNFNANSVYEIPSDLNYNPLNQEINDFTLGQLRDHITKVFENTPGLTGDFIGKNNSRDLGNIKKYGGKIVQNLGSTHLANLFLNDVQANFVESLLYAQREYVRYKNKFLELLYNMPLSNPLDTVKSVDEVINEISSNKSQLFPFFASDMLAFGNDYKKLTYKIIDPTVTTYDLTDIVDFANPNEKAVSIYLNGKLLIKDLEYTIPADRPVVELIVDSGQTYFNQSTLELNTDDVLEIREYFNTDGSHAPPTPTKLGLYPAFVPQIIIDGRDNVTRSMLRGHDGSLTALFGDHRDDCLMEFERRIYNNLKVKYTGEVYDYRDYLPGGFRNTPYTKEEYDTILSGNFNSWLGKTGLKLDDYSYFDSNDSWTWNYKNTTNKVDGKPMPAAYWRGIFQHYFGTDAPHLRPWEMLGFVEEPIWWTFYYGFAPYTRGNLVLWDDLSRGYIADGERKGIDKRFARPDLIKYIPVDESGNMLSPLECLVKERNKNTISGTFVFGDSGPIETAWRQSSEYPFAMQLALALMQPAEYFGGNIDKNRQVLEDFGINGKQWIYSDTRRRNNSDQYVHGEMDANGNTIRINSYTTWISEYVKGMGLDRTRTVGDKLRRSTMQLAYKVAGYTDKKFLKIYADQATPNSTNVSVMIPDDDFDIVLVKGAPTQSITYSGVIVTKSTNGYKVSGYDDNKPYFTIEVSSTSGRRDVISVGNVDAVKYLDTTGRLLQVPYGTEFLNADQVVDFLISYGRYLTRMGFQFTDKMDEDAGFYKDWDLAAREFLFYVQQGWEEDIAISLSPVDRSVTFQPPVGTVDGLTNKVAGTRILTEDYQILRAEDYIVNREGRRFSLNITKENVGIYLLDIDVVNYEHVLVFENTTQFSDLIYDPTVGSRQYRLKVKGFKTGNWDGSFGAAGFIINEDNIEEWQQGKNYYKGDIVLFKNSYYTASENIAGSTEFDNSIWLKSDYNKVSKGLLPSLANKAGQFKSFYDINSVNLELDADKLGKGLIGLRPRSYFENLQISDTSQAKFYQGLITQKGSRNSLDKLLRAKLDNFDGSVDFYEDWAIRTGQYGATGIRQQIQLEINEANAIRDPVLIELLGPNENPVSGRISYRENDIWAKPRPFNSNFLGTRSGSNLPGYLPTAGYVRLDDVNWTSTSMANLNSQVSALQVGRGDTIYVASDQDNQWSVYRINETGIKAKNLTIAANGVATFEFDKNHGLSEADVILIKTVGNNPAVTSFYTVASRLSNTKITVNTNYGLLPATPIDGQLYKLINQRFGNISEVAAREPLLGWEYNEKLFIDSATQDGWGVYEKQNEFTESNSYFAADPFVVESTPLGPAYQTFIYDGSPSITLTGPTANPREDALFITAEGELLVPLVDYTRAGNTVTFLSPPCAVGGEIVVEVLRAKNANFGQSVSVNINNNYMVVGMPGRNSAITYNLVGDSFQQDLDVSAQTTGAERFGEKIVTSDTGIVAISAPASDSNTGYVFIMTTEPETQKLAINQAIASDTLDPSARFGESIAISNDGDWLAIGQPDVDGGYVYLYQYYDKKPQPVGYDEIEFIEGTLSYTLTGAAAKNARSTDSVSVSTDEGILRPWDDYILNGDILTFTLPPIGDGGKLYVEVAPYEPEQVFITDGSTSSYLLTGNNANPTSIYAIKVVANNTLLVPFRDYDLVGNYVTLLYTPDAGTQLRVTQKGHYALAAVFSGSDAGLGDRFGASVDITQDGRRIVVGSPLGDAVENDSGKVYVYDRTCIEFVGDGQETTFAASVQTPVCKVFVNDELVQPELGDNKGDYDIDSGDVVFTIAPPAGSLIRIENNFVVETAILESPLPEENANLGVSVLMCPTNCSVYAGAPRTDGIDQKDDTGAVLRWVNQGRLYGSITGTIISPTANNTAYLIINDRWVEITAGDTLDDIIDIINASAIPGVVAESVDSKLRIHSNSIVALDKLKITSTDITLLDDLGLEIFKHVQTINSPENEEYGRFGEHLAITPDAVTLVVASDRATSRVPLTLDGGDTKFDKTMTVFIDVKPQSGAVYTYQYITRPDDSIETPGQFIPAQKLVSNKMDSLDMFGSSVSVSTSRIFVGVPGDDTYSTNSGLVVSYDITNSGKAWSLIRNEVPKVNTNLINRINLIDSKKNIIVADLDFIDPFKGKISGIAAQEIEYRVSYDPAVYNVDPLDQLVFTSGVVWGREQVGKLWWNTSQVRWMEYEQGSLEYRTVNWGTAFPNSTIFCLEWTESTVPPDQYNDPNNRFAFVIPNSRYSRIEYIDDTNAVQVRYYFWVGGKTSVPDAKGRRISAVDVESLIANPKASGVSYAAFVGPNAIALFNCNQYFRDSEVLLSIDYDVSENQDNIHAEYQLISEGDATSLPAEDIIVKLIDSIAGSDIQGRIVPDITLSLGRKYGKEFRPRQSMFRDRNAALKVATDYINNLFKNYPILLEKDVSNILASEELPPITPTLEITDPSYNYSDKVANLTELGYVLINVSELGYKVAVESDESVDGRWTIYQVGLLPNGTKVWNLAKVQSYVNERFIDRIDWVKEGEIALTNTDWAVNFNYQLPELLQVATEGQTAKVRDDGRGLYTIYKLDANSEWQAIIREKATLRINPSIYDNTTQQGYDLEGFDLKGFDEWQNLEIQRIFRAVYDDIFTVDLEIEKNNWFFIMMQHLLQEQQYVDWLFKTSFIKVEQRQRAIIQIPTYQRDNQDLVRQYIEEVKPYHTKIREYVLGYDGSEQLDASTTDFDVPAYYIAESNRYRSPNGSETIDAFILDLEPYTAWRDNHGFYIESIEVIDGGSGYSTVPSVTVTGGGGSGATVVPFISGGSIESMTVINPGRGYTSTPSLVLGSTSGTGARFVIRLSNNTVRKISNTMKFDRIGTPRAGFLVQFKDASGNAVDVRNELISRRESDAGVMDYLLDILSQSIVDYVPGNNGKWIVGDLATMGYPVPEVPNHRFFNDASGRVNVLYQARPQGWNAETLESALRDLGTSVGANNLDISGTIVTIDGSMTSYAPSIFEWTANTFYQVDDIVTYNNNAYRVIGDFTSDEYFTGYNLEILDGSSFDNHLDRTWAYYRPRGGQFGRDLGQLFAGVDFPGVNVRGPTFSMEPGMDTAGYDNDAFDSFAIDPDGVRVIDPAVMDQVIRSDFTDSQLGVRPEDIIVHGNDFLHPYYSHAPEEMIPGRVYDTLNIKVFSTPSSDWFEGSKLGLPIVLSSAQVSEYPTRVFDYSAPADRAATLLVFTSQTGRLIENEDYTADRARQEVTITRTLLNNDTVYIYAIDNGGPKMFYTNDFVGDGCTLSFNIPVDRNLINQFYVMVDGVRNEDWTLLPEMYTEGESTVFSTLVFDAPPEDGASIYVYVFYTSDNARQAFTEIHNTAVTVTGSSYPANYIINLDRPVGYEYPFADKIIVELNGNRLRPPNQAYYTGDGSTTIFALPNTVYIAPDDIVDGYIKIGVDGVQKNVFEHWQLSSSDGSTIRSVVFDEAPAAGSRVVISVNKDAAYNMIDIDKILISSSISLSAGDRFNILTFTNHDAIEMNTQVFEGSSTETRTADIGFDDIGYDAVPLDALSVVLSTTNTYTMDRPVTKNSYLWVDVDVNADGTAQHLNPNIDYVINDNGDVEITNDVGITPDSIIIITYFGELAQKPSMGFRVFKDMNDNFEYYRIARDNTTYLTQDLYLKDEWIYVEDASKLPESGADTSTPGQVMINGEMIRYFVRDLENNRLGQIRRGVNGTGAAMNIPAGTMIQDSSKNQVIPNAHGKIWYDPGAGTASNGLGLQNSNTIQAQFLLATATIPES